MKRKSFLLYYFILLLFFRLSSCTEQQVASKSAGDSVGDELHSNINIPESFGRTNFIVGVDPQEIIDQSKVENSVYALEDILKPTKHGIRHVLFAPNDNVLDVLKQLIEKEKTSIRMAAFLLTDYEIVKSLIQAKENGILIEIVFDPKGIRKRYAKTARLLRSKGIDIFVYRPSFKKNQFSMSNIMHNKFIIFGENVFGKSLV